MKDAVLNPSLLLPTARALLLAAFGARIILGLRKGDVRTAFERFALGFLCLVFFEQGFATLQTLSSALATWIEHLGDPNGLKAALLSAYEEASNQTGDSHGASMISRMSEWRLQLLRTGIWGVAKGISELAFLAVAVMLENAQAVLWKILAFIFPVLAAVVPIAPGILMGAVLFAVELSLWVPVLRLVQVASSAVAQVAHEDTGTLGISIIATELVAVFLYLSIPMFTHRLLSGALHGDPSESTRAVMMTTRFVKGGLR